MQTTYPMAYAVEFISSDEIGDHVRLIIFEIDEDTGCKSVKDIIEYDYNTPYQRNEFRKKAKKIMLTEGTYPESVVFSDQTSANAPGIFARLEMHPTDGDRELTRMLIHSTLRTYCTVRHQGAA